ncbi:uncharacterized protein BP5553_02993 [Venustampulla echinocandica]|uniref:RRM domain-containing protein n=1 Tax=Venustampulla echinocandica TaxID=2656787 RepID=A0A370TT22_9HELO|nr:uncharacterized protein BP5553_02993 [Venustampulla echinocandica]RDL38653.1 hypothetical protein BP5553_02993 [Venustampulla echinocandica]
MDSNNWRVKREPVKDGGGGFTTPNARSSQQWGKPNRDSDPNQQRPQALPSWGAMPVYTENRPLYRGGSNPTTGPFSRPIPRGLHVIIKDPQAEEAIAQGRRIYVGNLPYDAKINDIRALFADISHLIQDISMSVDPMTGRNPSYCFVDFTTKEAAEKTIEQFNGVPFMKRPLKVRPSVKPGTGTGRYHLQGGSESQSRATSTDSPAQEPTQNETGSPYVFDRWRRLNAQIDLENLNSAAMEECRRLDVGGLPRFPDQPTTNLKMRELFKDYNVEVVSKLRPPPKSIKEVAGNHYHCFVDLRTKEEADHAVSALNETDRFNWTITVLKLEGISTKLHERERVYIYSLPRRFDDRTLVNEVKGLLEPFGELRFVSDIFNHRPTKDGEPSNWCCCYVEFAEGKQADAAIHALDKVGEVRGCKITVGARPRGALEEHFSKPE